MRSSNRTNNQIRKTEIIPSFNPYAEGSCLIKMGNTHVICTASVDETVPSFLRNKHQGWVTAEYSMLPRATHSRTNRESATRVHGRTQEIQRLIGRSLRSIIDLKKLGERQIIVDCDVIQADGGTRTASITGGYVALALAIKKLMNKKLLSHNPLIDSVAAISCGIVDGNVMIDLEYSEDSRAQVDANFVLTSSGQLVEIQATAEQQNFSTTELLAMLKLAQDANLELMELQQSILQ